MKMTSIVGEGLKPSKFLSGVLDVDPESQEDQVVAEYGNDPDGNLVLLTKGSGGDPDAPWTRVTIKMEEVDPNVNAGETPALP